MPYIFRPIIISGIINTGVFLFFGANRYGGALGEFDDLPDYPGGNRRESKAHEDGEYFLTPVAIEQ